MEREDLTQSEVYQRAYGKRDYASVFYVILAVLLLFMIFFRVYLAQNYMCVDIDGSSMRPTLESGEVLLAKKTSKAKRGDIIIVDVSDYRDTNNPKSLSVDESSPFGENTWYLIKRLIAVEGDSVYCENGTVYIRYAGKTYAEGEWDKHPSDEYILDGENSSFVEYVVGEGEIFFLGDNRCNSLDSRYNENKSHLSVLYKAEDICAVVTERAYENREWIAYLPGVYDPKRKHKKQR